MYNVITLGNHVKVTRIKIKKIYILSISHDVSNFCYFFSLFFSFDLKIKQTKKNLKEKN